MTKLKTLLTKYPAVILFSFYFLVHLVLININVAEWGDSYRILRAALHIDNLTYPNDEKRPPLFSALISIFPQQPDPVLWGRVVVFGLGAATFALFLKLLKMFLVYYNKYSIRIFYLGGLLFIFNPVLFYWSLRVMSDVLFLFLVVLAFFVYYFLQENSLYSRKVLTTEGSSRNLSILQKPTTRALLLGFIAGLAVLTRFEGYILFGALGLDLGVSFLKRKDLKSVFIYIFAFLVLYVPFIVWRNPINSSYFEEPGGRVYDINTLFIFILAFLFSFGFVSAPKFIKAPSKFLQNNIALASFLIVDFILVLLWPAAVPRLLMPMLPFLLIFIVLNIAENFSLASINKDIKGAIVGLGLLALYVVGQLYYKQQFMVVNKYVFVVIVLISVASTFFIFTRNASFFYASIVVSAAIWSSSVIYLHKDLYTTLVVASEYMVENIKGSVQHNDTASIIEWNITYRDPQDNVTGDFKTLSNGNMIDYNKLITEKKYDYLVVTTEERPAFSFKPENKYLSEVFSAEKYTNGALFSTKIYKIKYE